MNQVQQIQNIIVLFKFMYIGNIYLHEKRGQYTTLKIKIKGPLSSRSSRDAHNTPKPPIQLSNCIQECCSTNNAQDYIDWGNGTARIKCIIFGLMVVLKQFSSFLRLQFIFKALLALTVIFARRDVGGSRATPQ